MGDGFDVGQGAGSADYSVSHLFGRFSVLTGILQTLSHLAWTLRWYWTPPSEQFSRSRG